MLSLEKNTYDRMRAVQSVSTSNLFPSSQEERMHALNGLGTMKDPISTCLFSHLLSDPIIIKMIGKNDDEVKKSSSIDFEACFGNDAEHMMILDCMHMMSNFSLRIISYMNRDIPTPAVRESFIHFFENLGIAFPNASKMIRDVREGLLIQWQTCSGPLKHRRMFAESEYGCFTRQRILYFLLIIVTKCSRI